VILPEATAPRKQPQSNCIIDRLMIVKVQSIYRVGPDSVMKSLLPMLHAEVDPYHTIKIAAVMRKREILEESMAVNNAVL
jgi:hypothetical protein